ncbi:MAG: ribose-5-phosphate isomerase RpiA [Isosphaeraceae bacterium]|nr:ribose-5-phosphate isomerase RpiA [Isosphaeraceae bacterium]
MSQNGPPKVQAAHAAAGLVESGMLVGLGSGTTATEMVRALGRRVREYHLHIQSVATSNSTAELARAEGITVRELDDVDELDICLDGADEVDPSFRLIKGRGGALLREKIVAAAARVHVTMITPEKRVDRLGKSMPIPVEVSTVGLRHTERRLRALGAQTSVRMTSDGSLFRTDGGNAIVDCRFTDIDDVAALDSRLQNVVGVFDTGIFLGLCDVLLVGYPGRAERIDKSSAIPSSDSPSLSGA